MNENWQIRKQNGETSNYETWKTEKLIQSSSIKFKKLHNFTNHWRALFKIMSPSILTPTHKYAAGALFGLSLHQAQIHQTCPLGFPPDDSLSEERSSNGSSSDSVSDDPHLWVHESSALLRPIFKLLIPSAC